VSVVICTRDREQSLRTALASVLALDYPDFEVVVVDNAARTDATRSVIAELADPRLRLVAEPRPGLSVARNRGVRSARYDIVAFTDDDVIADPGWLRGLVRGFTRAARVGCVTGSVPPAQLDTEAQAYFDAKVQWTAAPRPRLLDLGEHRLSAPLYPYLVGTFGAGANFALSRAALDDVGAFDEALGAGTPAQGGEDLDYFLRCILAGWTIAQEPAALVWHVHRREMSGLDRQLVGYGSGLSAFLFKHVTDPRTARDMLRRAPLGAARMLELRRRGETTSATAGLRSAELSGLVRGPVRYVRGRRAS
jgi:glycosyltransferase involved in cell wall biosynthesis